MSTSDAWSDASTEAETPVCGVVAYEVGPGELKGRWTVNSAQDFEELRRRDEGAVPLFPKGPGKLAAKIAGGRDLPDRDRERLHRRRHRVQLQGHPFLQQKVGYTSDVDGFTFAAQAGIGVAVRCTEGGIACR